MKYLTFMVFFSAVLKMPLYLAFLLTVLVVTLLGVIFVRLAIHPLKEASLITLIMITLAGSILFRGGAMFLWGKDPYALPPFTQSQPLEFLGATLQPQIFWVLGITVLAVAGVHFFFNRTLIGKAITACAFNPLAARLMGINVRKMVLLSFALSAAVGAVAGAIITPITLMEYDRGPLLGLKGFAAAVLGGDQIVLYLALSGHESGFTTEEVTNHLMTNLWAIGLFHAYRYSVEGRIGEKGTVRIMPL